MPNQYDPQKELSAALTEFGSLAMLVSSASTLSGSAIGSITVATLTGAAGVTTIAVSLPAVAAVGVALYLGTSLARRGIKAMNE
ncbi:hypothetical protein LEP3755_20240 [Leptolyngbya sp. NIES-3755]|nr:hypothetical protein LEP3755_20240 [Leptolyngbya sp. NIES-3755]